MIGSLLRKAVIWPLPPRYSGLGVATSVLTIVLIAVAEIHSFPGVLAAAMSATTLVLGTHALRRFHRSAHD
jgi:hypothetical protein